MTNEDPLDTIWAAFNIALVLVLTDYFTFRANEPSLRKKHSTKTIKKMKSQTESVQAGMKSLVHMTLLCSFQ